jgi:hypothetical protein
MGLIDKAREVYKRRRRKGDLWAWAKKPERARRRVERWKALAEFAHRKRKRNRAIGNLVQAKAWTEARTIYRKKFRHLREKLDERQPEQTPSTGVGFSTPSAPWNPYGRQIPNWMIPWLWKIYNAGCHFAVVSGVRTPEYSESLCYGICGAPSCPGRCAGRSSNHNMVATQGYPYGALDVSNYYSFGVVARQVGSPLINALGAQDPVHFSVSGR